MRPKKVSFFCKIVNPVEDKSYVLAHPSGVLSVEIVRGRNLVKKDLRGSSDPYVVAK